MKLSMFSWRLLLVLALCLPALLGPVPRRPQPAEAQGLGGVLMVGRIFGGLRARNRVYRDANAYIGEKQEYYDRLRETARDQLRARKVGGLRRSQVAAYIKVVALIEAERQGMIDFAEGEKRAARAEFLDTVERTIVDRILASGAAQRALGALKDGVDSVDDLIDDGLDQLAGGGGGALHEVAQVREIATRAGQVASLVGGEKGSRIAGAMQRVVRVTRAPTAEIEDGLRQVQEEIAPVRGEIEELQQRGRTPTANDLAEPVVMAALPDSGDEPAVDVIVGVLAGKAAREDASFRDRARAAITGQFLARCAAIGEGYREAVARLEGEAAGEAMSGEEVTAPCNALDLEELAREVQAEATEVPDADPSQEGDEPWIAVVEASKRIEGECINLFDTTQEGGFCPVGIYVTVEYGGMETEGHVLCTDFGQKPIGEQQPTVESSGLLSFDKFYEDPINRTLFEGNFLFAKCQLMSGDEQLALVTVRAEDVPWAEGD